MNFQFFMFIVELLELKFPLIVLENYIYQLQYDLFWWPWLSTILLKISAKE